MTIGRIATVVVVSCLTGCLPTPRPDPSPTPPTSSAPAETPTETPTESTRPTPTFAGWDEVFGAAGDAVLRVSVLSCDDGASMGTAFAVSDDTLVTAAHVAVGARTLSVQDQDGHVLEASTLGLVPEHDVAVLRTTEPLASEPLELSDAVPGRGSALAVLGYPLGTYDLRIVQGIVTGLPEPVDYGDQYVERAFTTDAATNPGNSGGPVVDETGRVVGLVSGGLTSYGDRLVEGVHYVIPVEDVASGLRRFADAEPLDPECADEVEPAPGPDLTAWDGELRLDVASDADAADAIGQVLYTHGLAINQGAYAAAFELFTPREQAELGGLERWSAGVEDAWWADIDVLDVDPDGELAVAAVALRTFDVGEDSARCTLWRLDYAMQAGADGWLIDRVTGDKAAC